MPIRLFPSPATTRLTDEKTCGRGLQRERGKLAPAITRQKIEDREKGPADLFITPEDVSLLRVAADVAN
jgi:hypothetical protein